MNRIRLDEEVTRRMGMRKEERRKERERTDKRERERERKTTERKKNSCRTSIFTLSWINRRLPLSFAWFNHNECDQNRSIIDSFLDQLLINTLRQMKRVSSMIEDTVNRNIVAYNYSISTACRVRCFFSPLHVNSSCCPTDEMKTKQDDQIDLNYIRWFKLDVYFLFASRTNNNNNSNNIDVIEVYLLYVFQKHYHRKSLKFDSKHFSMYIERQRQTNYLFIISDIAIMTNYIDRNNSRFLTNIIEHLATRWLSKLLSCSTESMSFLPISI
jgi:hypothetical protein